MAVILPEYARRCQNLPLNMKIVSRLWLSCFYLFGPEGRHRHILNNSELSGTFTGKGSSHTNTWSPRKSLLEKITGMNDLLVFRENHMDQRGRKISKKWPPAGSGTKI